MEVDNNSSTFDWINTTDVPSLPTDYSTSYLEGKWNLHHGKIGNYITKHPLFDYFYQWMRYVSPDATHKDPYVQRGIPAELEPFFHEFITEAQAQKITYDSLENDQEVLKSFDKHFSLHLHRKAVTAEAENASKSCHDENSSIEEDAVESGLYWYRRLYENRYFKNAVSLDYWDREYDWRCQAIKELSQALPQDEQISLLKDIISILDVKIAYVFVRRKQIIEKAKMHKKERAASKQQAPAKKQRTFLQTFPLQLINAIRQPIKTSNFPIQKSRKAYRIPNIPLKKAGLNVESLEAAFPLMQKNLIDEESRKYVRSVYLNHVCTTPPKSKFQQSCDELQSYLDLYITTPQDIDKYKDYIFQYCQYYFFSFWRGYDQVPNDSISSTNPKTALEKFAENIISSYYSVFLQKFQHVAEFIIPIMTADPVASCNSRKDHYVQHNFDNGTLKSDMPQKFGSALLKQTLQELWAGELFPIQTMPESKMSDEEISQISSIMAHWCNDVHLILSDTTLPWATKDTFQNAWNRYYQTQADFSPDVMIAYADVLDAYLTYGMFVLRTWISYKEAQSTTLDMFNLLTEYINKKKSRPPKAACQDSAVTPEDSKQSDADRSGRETVRP